MHKKPLIFFLSLITCSFIIRAQELTEKQKKEITTELQTVFQDNIRTGENLDIQELTRAVDDRYKAGFITNGNYFPTFDSLMVGYRQNIRGISGQKINIHKKNITILAADLALISAVGKSQVYLITGGMFSVAIAWTFIYKKINNSWKVIYSHQSGKKID